MIAAIKREINELVVLPPNIVVPPWEREFDPEWQDAMARIRNAPVIGAEPGTPEAERGYYEWLERTYGRNTADAWLSAKRNLEIWGPEGIFWEALPLAGAAGAAYRQRANGQSRVPVNPGMLPNPGGRRRTGLNTGTSADWIGGAAPINNPAHSAANLQRLNASLRLQETLGQGRIVGLRGVTIEIGQTRLAVLDTKTGRIYYGPSSAGRHFDLVERLGLPPTAEGRYVGGFVRVGENGKITFIHESGTYPPSHITNMTPRRIDDLIRGAGANPVGGSGY
jgi:hypothetical protein